MTTPTGPAADIALTVRRLAHLLPQLSIAITQPGPAPEVSTARRAPGSRPPWNAPAANALMAIHAGARDLEADLSTYINGIYLRRRDGSDAGTYLALQAIADWSTQILAVDELHRIAYKLGVLVDQAEAVPHIGELPIAINGGVRCPHCRLRTLTTTDDGGIECANIRCENPATHEQPRWSRAQWPALLRLLGAAR